MKIHDVVQGSPEWKEVRAVHDCASEAPVMMGHSPHVQRSDLVRMKATGDEREISDFTQKLFDRGHEVEAFARQLVEAELGEELYPVTCSDGRYLASYDGVTMDDETGWECKLWNAELAEQVRRKDLGPAYWPQLEQQIAIKELKRVLFTVSDGTAKNTLTMEYRAVPGRIEQVLAAWKQFDADVANYQHVEVLPPAVAAPTLALPALAIQVKGEIQLTSNLKLFGEALHAFIDKIDKDPKDDQAFANAAAAVTILKTAEEKLEAAEASALAQTASVDEMRSTVALYKELARTTRLMLDKLVEAKKKTIREDIRVEGVTAVAAHIAKLNERLGKPYMPSVPTDFATAMRAKKSIVSLRDGMETEVARVKIAANAIADAIQVNVNLLAKHPDHAMLFADAATIVLKATDDFAVLVKARIAEHAEKERVRLEAERERIRLEETAKLARKAQEDAQAQPPVTAAATQPSASAQSAPASKPSTAKISRPTDDQIIAVLADHFHVHETSVVAWLIAMDLPAASERTLKEFVS